MSECSGGNPRDHHLPARSNSGESYSSFFSAISPTLSKSLKATSNVESRAESIRKVGRVEDEERNFLSPKKPPRYKTILSPESLSESATVECLPKKDESVTGEERSNQQDHLFPMTSPKKPPRRNQTVTNSKRFSAFSPRQSPNQQELSASCHTTPTTTTTTHHATFVSSSQPPPRPTVTPLFIEEDDQSSNNLKIGGPTQIYSLTSPRKKLKKKEKEKEKEKRIRKRSVSRPSGSRRGSHKRSHSTEQHSLVLSDDPTTKSSPCACPRSPSSNPSSNPSSPSPSPSPSPPQSPLQSPFRSIKRKQKKNTSLIQPATPTHLSSPFQKKRVSHRRGKSDSIRLPSPALHFEVLSTSSSSRKNKKKIVFPVSSSDISEEELRDIRLPSSVSKEFISRYYENLSQNKACLESMKKLGVTTLETEVDQQEKFSEKMPSSISQTLKGIKDGSLSLVTSSGSTDMGLEVWREWRELIGDIFYFFDYSFEDGEGGHSSWSLTRRHDFNRRIDLQDRLKFQKNCTVSDGMTPQIRRSEIIKPLSESHAPLGEQEKKWLSMSQYAYRTRKNVEHSLALLDAQDNHSFSFLVFDEEDNEEEERKKEKEKEKREKKGKKEKKEKKEKREKERKEKEEEEEEEEKEKEKKKEKKEKEKSKEKKKEKDGQEREEHKEQEEKEENEKEKGAKEKEKTKEKEKESRGKEKKEVEKEEQKEEKDLLFPHKKKRSLKSIMERKEKKNEKETKSKEKEEEEEKEEKEEKEKEKEKKEKKEKKERKEGKQEKEKEKEKEEKKDENEKEEKEKEKEKKEKKERKERKEGKQEKEKEKEQTTTTTTTTTTTKIPPLSTTTQKTQSQKTQSQKSPPRSLSNSPRSFSPRTPRFFHSPRSSSKESPLLSKKKSPRSPSSSSSHSPFLLHQSTPQQSQSQSQSHPHSPRIRWSPHRVYLPESSPPQSPTPFFLHSPNQRSKSPTTKSPTKKSPTTKSPTTKSPTTKSPTTKSPTKSPTTKSPTTKSPTTKSPTTKSPPTKSPMIQQLQQDNTNSTTRLIVIPPTTSKYRKPQFLPSKTQLDPSNLSTASINCSFSKSFNLSSDIMSATLASLATAIETAGDDVLYSTDPSSTPSSFTSQTSTNSLSLNSLTPIADWSTPPKVQEGDRSSLRLTRSDPTLSDSFSLTSTSSSFDSGKPKVNVSLKGPLKEGDVLVRLFGMKGGDGFFVRGKLVATHVSMESSGRTPGIFHPFKCAAQFVGTATGFSTGMQCHGGFYDIWQRINKGCWDQYEMDFADLVYHRWSEEKDKTKRGRIVLVGHSMGACLASIAAYQLINRYPETQTSILVITLGAPLFARKGFNDWIESNVEVLNISLVGDPTITLPGLPFTGWNSPGRRLWISPHGVELEESDPHFQYWELLRFFLLRF